MTGYRHLMAFMLLLALCLPLGALAEDTDASDSTPFITDFQWITYGSNITQITTGLQFSHKRWYTELTLGGFSAYDNREAAFFLGLNLGHRFPVKSWLNLTADLGYRHIIPDGSDNPAMDTSKFSTLDVRIRLEAVLGRYMSVFIGGATTNIYTDSSFGTVDTNENSIFWGVGLL